MNHSLKRLDIQPDCEIVAIRLLQQPVAKVYRAWTDPVLLALWWGPIGFTNTFLEYNPEPGGLWRFIMHGPDGNDYPNECVFIDLIEHRCLVWNHLSKPFFQVVVSFDERPAAQTLLTFKMVFESAEACAKVKLVASGKNEENLDKLEALLYSQD